MVWSWTPILEWIYVASNAIGLWGIVVPTVIAFLFKGTLEQKGKRAVLTFIGSLALMILLTSGSKIFLSAKVAAESLERRQLEKSSKPFPDAKPKASVR